MAQVEALWAPLTDLAVDVGTRIVGAILLWIVGKVLIGLVKRAAGAALSRRAVDPTLARYVDSSLGVLLTVVLVIGVLGVFGVETTTFAGLLAAAGVAIGMAWSGMLSNFAAGVFMIVLRPFKVGDMIEAAGVLGTVHEIGLFVTTVDTPDNVRTYLGNNAVFSSTIRNYTTNPFRRVDLVAQLAHGTDHVEAAKLLRAALAKIPNVATTPAPDVEILEFNLAGPVLAVRPYCHNDHYWQVYFDTNRTIRESFGAKGYAVPSTHVDMTTHA